LASAGKFVVGGLNTASNLVAQNIYDGDTYAQARSELDANEMAVSGAIEGGHNVARAVAADPLGSAEKAHQASVQFTVDAAMGEAHALAGVGKFTGEFLAAPAGGFAARGTGRLATSFGDTARAAGRLDFDARDIDAQMYADAAPIGHAPVQLVEAPSGQIEHSIAEPSTQLSDEALFARSSFRKSSHKQMRAEAEKSDAGELICPTCKLVMPNTIVKQTAKGPVNRIGYDGDHFPDTDTWAERINAMKAWLQRPTRSQVLDEYNRRLRAQCPDCNKSHKFEGVPGA